MSMSSIGGASLRAILKPVTLASVAALALGLLASGEARAQANYPNQTIRLIVPFAAGGLPDTVARIVAQSLQEKVKQSVVVENRPGGGGSVGALALAGAPADGYQFIVTDNSFLSINPSMYKSLTYNPKDFITVARLATAPLFLAAHPKLPVKTMKEFIAYAKANPGKINYGSSGVGSTHHLSMEAIKAQLKLDMAHVPFKGTGQSVPALLGGHVEILFSAYPSLASAVTGNKVAILATNSLKRSPQAPDVPAISEFIPGFNFAPMIGIFGRAGTPDAIVQRIAKEAMAVVKEPDVIKRFNAAGIESDGAGPADFRKALEDETARVQATVKAAGITPQ
jgi:tripartite-type tricarboxylate transporter receptor subunit TctC